MNFTIALAQIDSVLGDIPTNIKKHEQAIKSAINAGAQLIVFPELSLTGYSIKDLNWNLALSAHSQQEVLKPLLEKSGSISILLGGVEESDQFHIYNSAFLLEDGQVKHVQRKIYPPTYGMFEEMRHFSKGKTLHAVDSKHGRLGILICEDLWHPSLPYLLALDGAKIIIALVASPTRVSGTEDQLANATTNFENHRAYARLHTTYLAFCNRVGFEDGVNFWGGSHIVAPDGETLATAKFFDEDMILATITDNEVRRARRFSRHFLDEDETLVLDELKRIRKERA